MEGLLAAGWKQAAASVPDLQREAEALAAANLQVIAQRVDTIAAATTPLEGVAALSMALRTCRLLRLHLADDALPNDWRIVEPATRAGTASRLIPVAPVRLDGTIRWASARLTSHGSVLVLVDALDVPSEVSPWLGNTHLLTAQLRWRKRLALGEETIDLFTATSAAWEKTYGEENDPLRFIREQVRRGRLGNATRIAYVAPELRLCRLDPDEGIAFEWLSPTLESAFSRREGFGQDAWVVGWSSGRRIVPLALLAAKGVIRRQVYVIHPWEGEQHVFRT